MTDRIANPWGERAVRAGRRMTGSASSDLPVLMFSACADEVDVVVGLEIGADDYIAKSLSLCVSW